MSSVSTQHPEYTAALERWRTTSDAAKGQEAVKCGGIRYLPDFIPPDEERYKAYKKRAYFLGVTGRTRDALTGMVFRKPANTEGVPSGLEFMLEDADGAGQSLDQVAKQATDQLQEKGRYVLLVDYPRADPDLDAETEAAMNLRPIIAAYEAEALINWKAETIKGRYQVTLAVLREQRDIAENEFDHSMETVYRVLRMRDGIYTQQLVRDDGAVIEEEYAPRMAGGAPFDYIPMHIIGSQNNRPDVDEAPLYDLAIVNIRHYQVTADHSENLFIHGQLTMGITTNLDSKEWKEMNPNGVTVGARKGIYLGAEGGLHSITAPESSSLRVALQDLREEMVAIGARLIQRGGQAETAEAARINASAEASTLDNLVGNLSEALEDCLEDAARFLGIDPDSVSYSLNREFWDGMLDPQSAMAIIQFGDSGIIARSDQRNMLRSGRLELPEGRSDEDIDSELAMQGV